MSVNGHVWILYGFFKKEIAAAALGRIRLPSIAPGTPAAASRSHPPSSLKWK
jgi:hypothetical protein